MSSLFDSKHVMVHADEGGDTMTVQWKKPSPSQEFQGGLGAVLEKAQENSLHRVVADHSLLKLSGDDEAYFLRKWVPQAGKAGIQRLAVVVERRQYVQIPKTRRVQRLKSGALTLHYFDHMDKAHIWVKAESQAA